MIIKADKEGQKAIIEMADLVLKATGLNGHQKVAVLLSALKDLEVDTPKLEVIKDSNESNK